MGVPQWHAAIEATSSLGSRRLECWFPEMAAHVPQRLLMDFASGGASANLALASGARRSPRSFHGCFSSAASNSRFQS